MRNPPVNSGPLNLSLPLPPPLLVDHLRVPVEHFNLMRGGAMNMARLCYISYQYYATQPIPPLSPPVDSQEGGVGYEQTAGEDLGPVEDIPDDFEFCLNLGFSITVQISVGVVAVK